MLKNQCLYYFKHKDDTSPCGIVPLQKVFARAIEPTKKRSKDTKRDTKRSDVANSCFFEIISSDIGVDGKRKPVRGCKTNSKGMVVAGLFRFERSRSEEMGGIQPWPNFLSVCLEGGGKGGVFTHTIDYARVSVCHSVCRSAGNHHRYLFKASSVDDAVDWISRIKYVFHVVRNRATATARKQAHQL